MTDLLLGVDLGTSSVKAVVTDLQGTTIAAAAEAYSVQQPRPGYAEQDPAAWWDALCRTVRGVTSQCDAAAIRAVGLSGQMHGTVLLDAELNVLGPAVIWQDQRSAAQVAEIEARVGRERLLAIAGSPVATGFMAATVRWLQVHEPDVWARVAHLLLPKDYLRLRMTGTLAGDPSDGSGALLLDVHTRAWSSELLAALDLAPELLPPLHPSDAIGGALTSAAATALGLHPGIPVAVGAADTACSALGAGAVEPGALLLTLSTGGQLIQPVATPVIDAQGRIHTFCSALTPAQGPGWYQMGATLTAGSALRWLRDNVLGFTGDDAYARMTALADRVVPGADGLLFLPYLAGERTPHMDPRARGLFLGLTLRHGQAELVRAVMEGVTLGCADAFAVLAELGAQPEHVILAGGGARSDLWQQMVADVFGLPVRPLQMADQSAAGAALLAGAGVGLFDLTTTARTWARYGAPVLPAAERHAFYRSALARFRAAYLHNRDLMDASTP
ncbi:MAG: xylulokinase [Caldilineaceae bacterium]|nr:xylulokinase [Caldilineaceae bacterium]